MEILNEKVSEVSTMISKLPWCQMQDWDGEELEDPGYQPLYCLFLGRENIPKKCRQTCLARIRLECESNSPALFGLFLEISEARSRLSSYRGARYEGVSQEQMQEAHDKVYKLGIFVEAVILALYPLIFANGSEFPFFTPAEILEAREVFSREGIDPTVREMNELNTEWYSRVVLKLRALDSEYGSRVYFLVQLFLRGLKRDQKNLFQKIEELVRGAH